ncbi:DUF760 domain-containing protein [Candidatus Atelocyanobacterium thalassae]|uniref:DUF760 domain-containing protein n=2 Tax=Candidatus Atelocyanobacterium thalassae TaxID=713887 RepID=A0A086CGZ7_9CHRO|nr:DUF760 domain-containing protein [Candidatus Atelocyanobacterium thalassa]KFF41461.1 MAG: Protein of unknown function (DUF760) [Candidatus Atelocyanobacterium thalassa isolate SIO64986]BDA40167.1 hypothetical protein CPARK_000100500 [cyanobacterium endosymbiont of Braarudosphaera bigelowii]
MVFNFDFLSEEQDPSPLIQYLKQQQPETLSRIAQSVSLEVEQIITKNVQGLMGILSSGDFNIRIATDRESLDNLLASAMMTGYFLSKIEQRKDLEVNFSNTEFSNSSLSSSQTEEQKE